MLSSEIQGLSQIRDSLIAALGAPRGNLRDYRTSEACFRQTCKNLSDRLVTPARNKVLITRRIGAIGQMQMCNSIGQVTHHVPRVRP